MQAGFPAEAGLPAGLTHDAFFYRSEEEFVAGLVPFIRDGLAAGQAAVAALTRPNIELMRGALGLDADAVLFIDRDEWYRRPIATIAGWLRLLAQVTARGQPFVRVIGEVAYGAGGRDPAWARYESALNGVFADTPTWIVCPYDVRALAAEVLASARHTHLTLIGAGLAGVGPAEVGPTHTERRLSTDYLPPEEFLRLVREPVPPVRGPPVMVLRGVKDVTAVRHTVADVATAGGWLPADRTEDLLFILTEIVANAVRHGHGQREVRVWAPPWGVVGEVTDEGPGPADPLVGYRPPGQAADRRLGLWIAGQMCDALEITTAHGVTAARFALWYTLPPALDRPFPRGAT